MTRDEMKKLLMVINASYPNWKIDNLSITIDTWFEFLGHYEYQEVMMAVKSYITSDKSGFAPSIGAINDLVNTIGEQMDGTDLNEMQAWSLVSNALRCSSWHSKEEFDKLPPLIQRAVGSADNLRHWATDDNYNESVIMSQFISVYKSVVKQEKQNRRMPLDVRQQIEERKVENLLIGKREEETHGEDMG